jgi:hypothetical protein
MSGLCLITELAIDIFLWLSFAAVFVIVDVDNFTLYISLN